MAVHSIHITEPIAYEGNAVTTLVTLSSDAFTQTNHFHKVAAQTGITDDLKSITPIFGGSFYPYILLTADTGDTITLKHNGAGATYPIYLAGDADVPFTDTDIIPLYYHPSGHWTNDVSSVAGGGAIAHNSTTGIQGGAPGDYFHLQGATVTDLTDGGATTLHKHDHGGMDGLADDDHPQYSLISSQAAVPSTTPSRVGEVNVATTSDRFYGATGTASAADWKRLDAGMVHLLSSTTGSGVDPATITLTGWAVDPQLAYRAFYIFGAGIRCDTAATVDNFLMQINSDATAANYVSKNIYTSTATAVVCQEIIGTAGYTGCNVGFISGTSMDATHHTILEVVIYMATDTTNWKEITARTWNSSGTTAELFVTTSGATWKSTAAITSLTFFCKTGTKFEVGGANEAATMQFDLYGLL